MAKNFEQIEGSTSYGKQVLLSIIKLATKEIAGVSSLHPKGVRAYFSGKTLDVDVYFNIDGGHTVSDVAFRVQENIKRGVETMTTYKVNTINAFIVGINFDKVEPQDQTLL